MRILAHRGLWNDESEKNTLDAIKRAYSNGFGVETDLRDYREQLVISHNIAKAEAPLAQSIFLAYKEMNCNEFLALNVKADGIQEIIVQLVNKYHIEYYAMFDMSIPEMVIYEKMGIPFFTRQSEFETELVLYDSACGVWMDEWSESWIRKDIIERHIDNGKYVGVISPEIHGRNNKFLWNELKGIKDDKIMLCTDVPLMARSFFND